MPRAVETQSTAEAPSRAPYLHRLAEWSVTHRFLVIGSWFAALVVAWVLAGAAGGAQYADSLSLPGTGSEQAMQLLQHAARGNGGDLEQIVVGTTDGRRLSDPDVRTRIEAMLDTVARLPHVSSVGSPYSPEGAAQTSKDGRIAFATVNLDKPNWDLPAGLARPLVDTVHSAAGRGIRAEVTGQLAESTAQESPSSTGFGILAAAVVLSLVFGSFFATLLPLASALAALGTGVALIELLSHVVKIPNISVEMVPLIGIGVGIDYALFIVTRQRQALLTGQGVRSAVITSVNTAGRAVLFAGIIVCISIFGMYALGVNYFYGMAGATAIGVALTMFASLTLLPALLDIIGLRVFSRRQRRRLFGDDGHALSGDADGAGFWNRWSTAVTRRSGIFAGLGLIAVLVVAVPFLSLQLGISDQGNDQPHTTTRRAYDMLAEGFGPGFNGPLLLVADVPDAARRAVVDAVIADVGHQAGVAAVTPPMFVPQPNGHSIATARAFPTTSPQDHATEKLIDSLRHTTIPHAVAGSGVKVYVGGGNAIFIDLTQTLTDRLLIFIGAIVTLSFVILMLIFRSFVIPLTAAVMNVLSIAAAFGVIVAVFQWGWGLGLIGLERTGPVESYFPVMLFAILFGLSMDYQVFLLSRMHEEWLRTGDTREAVRIGLTRTGRTITAAAAIMICVFAAFCLGPQRTIKEFGLGLAVGVLVDAIVIRTTIVPAVMIVFGRSNWWFPDWLGRVLPRISVEPPADAGADVGGADVGGADVGGADVGGADVGGTDVGGATSEGRSLPAPR